MRPGNAIVADEPHQFGQAGPRPVDRLLIVPTLVPRDSTLSLALPNDEQQGLALLAGQLGKRRMQILDREPPGLGW